jgi:hypothetical protein
MSILELLNLAHSLIDFIGFFGSYDFTIDMVKCASLMPLTLNCDCIQSSITPQLARNIVWNGGRAIIIK